MFKDVTQVKIMDMRRKVEWDSGARLKKILGIAELRAPKP